MKQIILFFALIAGMTAFSQSKNALARFYVGTTDGKLKNSILLGELNRNDGSIRVVDSFPGCRSPSYLCFSKNKKFLYAVNSATFGSDGKSHTISAFSIDKESGALTLINSQSSQGLGPCHLSVHSKGKFIFTANYSSGQITVLPVNKDGSLAPASDMIQHTGSGPDQERQKSAHAHCIVPDPSGKFVLAADLGTDKLMNYMFDSRKGKLIANPNQEFYSSAPAAGPRQLAFNMAGKVFYLLNEMGSTLTACSFDRTTGMIKELNTLSTLPESFNGYNKSAAVRIHPTEKWVYASNRGDLGSVAAYKILDDGSIELVQIQDQHIDFPRDFNIEPEGKIMLVGNQLLNSISAFSIDPENGKIEFLGEYPNISQPVCIVWLDR